jgi:hypothetical protein
VRVLQVGGELDLGQEALRADDGGKLGPQHLDGDSTVVPEILGEIDRGHAAGADLLLETVVVGQGGRDPGRRGHGCSLRFTSVAP